MDSEHCRIVILQTLFLNWHRWFQLCCLIRPLLRTLWHIQTVLDWHHPCHSIGLVTPVKVGQLSPLTVCISPYIYLTLHNSQHSSTKPEARPCSPVLICKRTSSLIVQVLYTLLLSGYSPALRRCVWLCRITDWVTLLSHLWHSHQICPRLVLINQSNWKQLYGCAKFLREHLLWLQSLLLCCSR